MNKALVDTTVLTDVLLNSGETRRQAKEALSVYAETLLPVFALKEFKGGPLKNFVWMHNKLVTVQSFQKALQALQRMSRTPMRYTTSTALQALEKGAGSIGKETLPDLQKKYGKSASLDQILCDEFRLALKTTIMGAWKRRRKVTTSVTHPIACFREVPPREKRGLLDLEPKGCERAEECALAPLLRSKVKELSKMRDAIKDSDKVENIKRARTLKQIYRTPNRSLVDQDCKSLGDAIFVLLCPDDAVILTTNTVDYVPLAQAVGKTVVSP